MKEELIQQYIDESQALIEKQASEIASLQQKLDQAKAGRKMDKQASEGTVCELISCLKQGQYKQESVINALLNKDSSVLVKEAAIEDVDDSWGELDDDTVHSDNLKPSERKLYARYGLI